MKQLSKEESEASDEEGDRRSCGNRNWLPPMLLEQQSKFMQRLCDVNG